MSPCPRLSSRWQVCLSTVKVQALCRAPSRLPTAVPPCTVPWCSWSALAWFALTAENGAFEVENVPPGTYEILAQREHLTARRQTVTIQSEQTTVVDFALELSPVHEEVTVTATPGGGTTTFEAFNAITTLDSFELSTNVAGTLGDALENQPGVAKRSFGPGSSRPIIRGFDGDRVLMMEDGIGTDDLASQSGDHGVTIGPERARTRRGRARSGDAAVWLQRGRRGRQRGHTP